MDDTPNLGLPYIMAAQSQKHVTHNEAIRALDAMVQLAVLDRDLAAPPGSPAEGARYIVGGSPTGAWSGHADEVAAYQDGAWMLYAPVEGWIAWIADEDVAVVWDGTTWSALTTGGGSGSGSFATLAINGATADTTNRLSLNAPATLLNHDGAGHQLKVNKAAAGDTASLLYQTGFSGRAELGLAGDDDFHFKVSPNGSDWNEAIVIDKDSGEVSFPNTSLGGGGGAPTTAEYIVKAANGGLSAERVLTDTATVVWDYATGDQAKANVPNDAVTFAKMQDIATDKLIGRDTASSGDPQEIGVAGGIEFDGAGNIQTTAFTGDVTKATAGTALTIAANAVTDAKLRDSAAVSVIGRSANASGDPADIAAAGNDTLLRRTADALSFGQLTVGMLPNDVVTYAKMQNVSATDKLLGRASSGAGDIEEIACTAFARSIFDDADAATARATLGVAIGSNVQAYHAYLADIAGLSPGDGDSIVWNAISGHWEADFVSGGGGGGGAPTDGEYIVKSSAGGLSAERVLTDTASLVWDYATGGQAKANVHVSAPARVLGRKTSGAGNVEELTLSEVLAFGAPVLTEMSLALSLLALQVADNSNAAVFPSDSRVADSFDALTYVDVAGATNLDSGTAGLLKPSVTVGTDQTNAGTGSVISSATAGFGGTSNTSVFDNNTSTFWYANAEAAGAISGVSYIGWDFGSGQTRTVGTVTIKQNQDDVNSKATTSVKLQWSNDGSSGWTDLQTLSLVADSSLQTFAISSPVAKRAWRIIANANISGGYAWSLFEVEFKGLSVTDNLTVRSASFTAGAAPALMKALIRVKEVDAATAGTDYTLEVSRDGGTTWTTATLTELFTSPSPTASIRVCQTNEVDVSGQPSGASPRWRFKTPTNKMIELYDAHLYWA